MSGNAIITAAGLGKRYQIGQQADLTRTFRETLITLPGFLGRKVQARARNLVRSNPRKGTRRPSAGNANGKSADPETPPGTFWALRDLDFEIAAGESVGIIGRNGAGKSTLLKILSRITTPTKGWVEYRGRISSLLEVGTGFHQELTGRENIFLNGSILGMRRAEIIARFDDIVQFAEVEQFLDTPVKRYSSGMRVRLAFSVAAHLQPEILIIDEVLAVGDQQFQDRCLGKMENVASEGRTVLFVSHNMQAVKRLCSRGILLEQGRIEKTGAADEIVEAYLDKLNTASAEFAIAPEQHASYPPALEIYRYELLHETGELTQQLKIGERARLKIFYRFNQMGSNFYFGVLIRSRDQLLLSTISSMDGLGDLKYDDKTHCAEIEFNNVFNPGRYYLEFKVKSGGSTIDTILGIQFTVQDVSVYQDAVTRAGLVHLNPTWRRID